MTHIAPVGGGGGGGSGFVIRYINKNSFFSPLLFPSVFGYFFK